MYLKVVNKLSQKSNFFNFNKFCKLQSFLTMLMKKGTGSTKPKLIVLISQKILKSSQLELESSNFE